MSALPTTSLPRRAVVLVWALAVATIGLAALRFNVLPLFVGAVVTKFGIGSARAGIFVSALFAASTAAGVFTSLLLHRLNRRLVLVSSLIWVSVGTTLSILAKGFPVFFVMQVITGIGGGVMGVVCYSLLGDLDHEDLVFGSLYAVTVLTAALSLYVLPAFLARFGLDGLLIGAGSASLVLAVLAWFVPAVNGKLSRSPAAMHGITVPAAIGLTAIFLWSVSQSVYWVYVERLGYGFGLSAGFIGSVLATATLGSGAVPVIGATLSRRFGHAKPLLVCTAIMSAGLLMLTDRPTGLWFGAAVIGHSLAWGLYEPYLNSLTALADVNGRAVPWIQPVGGIGIALGPLFGSAVVTDQSLAGPLYASVLTLVASSVCAAVSIRRMSPKPDRP